ncbi:sialic acid TRAP transporter substrate-binding protein SiaP [Sinorhizobium numidicum]|uniref:Sialic acid TRAP transporter substrate-binding protein SiaP n=1 Tax=Sinorhizobium numidicum TaxID=680248 RepID=A0ABY8CQ11_9HYPH|nr:sialic acid TRAP transporter substrate-binding protein SiaP [Sinorhizobium numidicum]WEX74007.1 sialic acid TRAP transporter substrate-binding protein SiaP [Sinorhizobium numidicum]WEX79992.1 sialic acid TRAP transporter substrate-binding protein SiaP [Sinorhizobium numidicum]
MKTGLISLALAGLLMASPVSAQETRTLRLGMQGTAGDPQFEGVTEAARIIKEKSGGRLTLEIFPNSQLGTFTEMMEQVTLGELDFTLNPFGGMDAWVPRAVVASTAYVVGDFDHLQKIIASDWGKGIVEEMRNEHKWRTVDSWYFGTRHTTAKKPIEKPADFAGMKLRVPNSAPLLTWAKAMGASPTPVAFAEVYLALQTNQVDGQENPLPIIDAMKFTEVQSHVSLTGHLVQDQLILMSEDTWNALEPADQKVVIEAFEAGGGVNNKLVTEKEASLVDAFRERGITVVEPDKAAFREAMKPVYADLDAQFGAGTVQTLLDLR